MMNENMPQLDAALLVRREESRGGDMKPDVRVFRDVNELSRQLAEATVRKDHS